MSRSYSTLTNRVHNQASRRAARKWQATHQEEWVELWLATERGVMLRRPELDPKTRYSVTFATMMSVLAEEYPQEWLALRHECLEQVKAELDWSDGRVEANKDKGKKQAREGGRWVKA